MNIESSRDQGLEPTKKGLSPRERLDRKLAERRAATDIQAIVAPLTQEQVEKSIALQQEREKKEKYAKLIDLLNRKTRGEKISTFEIGKLRLSLNLSQELLEKNLDRINSDPKFRDALVVAPEHMEDDSGKAVRTFVGDKLGEGGMGSIHLAHMVTSGSTALVDVVMKKPHTGEMSEVMQRLYAREVDIAKLISSLDSTQPGGENVIKTAFVSKEKTIIELVRQGPFLEQVPRPKKMMPTICYELIKDSDGKSRDLEKALEEVPNGRVIDGLAEAMKGLEYLHRNGLLHGDLKMANIMLSGDGKHKIIDTGAVITVDEIRTGKVTFADSLLGGVSSRWAQRLIEEGPNKGQLEGMPTTPYYNSHEVLEKLVQEGKPLDASEKRAMGVILRETLSQMGFFDMTDYPPGIEEDPYGMLKVQVKQTEDKSNAEMQKKYTDN